MCAIYQLVMHGYYDAYFGTCLTNHVVFLCKYIYVPPFFKTNLFLKTYVLKNVISERNSSPFLVEFTLLWYVILKFHIQSVTRER